MKLIPNASKALRMQSVQAAGVLAVLSAAQADLIPFVQPLVPAEYWPLVSGGFALLIGVVRLIAQPKIAP
jgi:hypothetical protein